jgi:D-inositol-3-phosphate glycosyltransferase
VGRRETILIVGEAVQPSGYATVLNGLLPHLAFRYDIHVFAIGYRGAPINAEWRIHPNPDFRDPWGFDELPRLIAEYKPVIVLFVYDLLLYLFHREALEASFPDLSRIVYCPIDGTAPSPSVISALAGLNRLVLYNETARRTIEGAASEPLVPCEVIPHGVATETYRPLGSRIDARRLAFPNRPDLWDGFIILNANRNNPRKRTDLTLEGFAAFARDKPPNVTLCLHLDRTEWYPVEDLARGLGISDRLIFASAGPGHAALSPEDMNVLYNACEVGINTSTGEGWGLVAFEHGAAGGAQIVPRHSACAELWHDAAVFLEPVATVRHPTALCENQVVSAAGVTAALQSLYKCPNSLESFSTRAMAHAHREQWKWSNIAARWDSLFQEVLACG